MGIIKIMVRRRDEVRWWHTALLDTLEGRVGKNCLWKVIPLLGKVRKKRVSVNRQLGI